MVWPRRPTSAAAFVRGAPCGPQTDSAHFSQAFLIGWGAAPEGAGRHSVDRDESWLEPWHVHAWNRKKHVTFSQMKGVDSLKK